MIKIWLFLVLLGVAATQAVAQAEWHGPIREAIKAGDAKALARHFNTSIEITLDGNVSSYSKTQGEFVMRDFFKKSPPANFTIMHTGASKGGLQYAIGRYESGGTSYNVLIRVKDVGGQLLIHEMSFVKE
ncbi:MAG: DUF4783 domain-containing protein [Cyclobacteriaceae bacterium]|jgi:hypothetical protein|nr:DUF4783 domain-containing protein [Flammeovirgaceae bacterium]